MSLQTIPVTVRAATAEGVRPALVGTLVAFSSSGVAPALIDAATDAYALALILAPKILPHWPLTLTIDITADVGDLANIVNWLGNRSDAGLWTLDFTGGVEIKFQAVTSDCRAVSTAGDAVTYAVELSPLTAADVSGGDIVTAMLDYRSRYTTINRFVF